MVLRKGFGRRLRFIRLLENKTQAGLAEAVGVTEEHLGNIERGVSVPSFDLIGRLCRELDTPANSLFLFSELNLSEEEEESASSWEGMDWKQYVTRLGFWSHDLRQGTTTLSNSLFEILGREPTTKGSDMRWFLDQVHPEDLPSVLDSWRRYRSGELPFSCTFRFHRKNGTLRLGLAQGEVETDDKGQVTRLYGVVLDITEQKRFEADLLSTRRKMEQEVAHELERRLAAEEERKETGAQLDLLLGSITDGVVYFRSPDLRVTWCNRTYLDFLKQSQEEVAGKHCYSILHGRNKPCPDCPVKVSFVTGRPAEHVERAQENGQFWSIRAFPVLDDEGKVQGVAEFAREVTDSKRAEEGRRHFEAMVNASREPMALLDRNCVFLAANDAHEDFVGLKSAELVGRHLSEVVDRDDFEKDVKPWFDRALAGERVEYEAWVDSVSKGRICMALRFYPYRGEDGSVAGVSILGMDVTETRLVQDRLQIQSQIVESSPDAMFFADKEFVYRIVNDRYLDLRGLKRKDVVGSPMKAIVPGDDFETHIRPRLERVLRGQTVRLTEWIDFPGPAPRCMDITYAPCRSKAGEVVGVVATLRDVSGRVRAQEALAESEERYRGLTEMFRRMADNMPDLLWAKDMNNRFLFTNQAICDKLLKCAGTSEPLGRDDLYFAQRERRAGQQHTFGEVCVDSDAVVKETGKPGRFLEDGLVRGQYLALDVHKAPFFDAEGNMIGTVGAGRDVTEDQAVRKALEGSEERFRLLAENSPDMVWLTNSQHKLIYASPTCERLLGYTQEEMLTLTRKDLFLPESLAFIEDYTAELQDAHAKGQTSRRSRRADLMHHAKGGRLALMEVTSLPAYDSQDRFLGVVGVSRDVGEQRRAEAEVRESLEKYRILFELEFDAILLVENETARILEANRAAERLFGFTYSELIRKRLTDLSTEPELTRQSCRSELTSAERYFRHKNGQVLPVEVNTTHFTWQGRRVHIAVMRDVSDRKRLEQERRDVERILRHELRTPAQAAVTVVNVLKEEGGFQGESLRMLNELERQGRVMLETMDLHADLHLLETGQYRLGVDVVDLAEICNSAARDMDYLAESRSVSLELDCPSSGQGAVFGDARLLRSAAVNLVKNAVEACGPGETVRLCCQRDGSRWLFKVCNPGVVPEAVRGRMFEKYATHGKLRGQGLGCYLVRRVAEAHRGEVWVNCGDGQNTLLVLALPAADQ